MKKAKQLKYIQLDANTRIGVLPHVDEQKVIDKFNSRKPAFDWQVVGALSNNYGSKNVSNPWNGKDY